MNIEKITSNNIKKLINFLISNKEFINKISNVDTKNIITEIINNLEELIALYPDIYEKYDESKITSFAAYYGLDCNLNKEEYYEMFKEMKEEYPNFLLYVIFKQLQDLYVAFVNPEDLNSWLEFLDKEYYESLLYYLETLDEIKLKEKQASESERLSKMPFTREDNKYKIFFPSIVTDAMADLSDNVKSSLISKLYILATLDVVPGVEPASHTKDLCNVAFNRIHLGHDYRIVFYRTKNITIIIDVFLKQNHDREYIRLDTKAKKIDKIISETEDFINGNSQNISSHYEIIQELQDIYIRRLPKQI